MQKFGAVKLMKVNKTSTSLALSFARCLQCELLDDKRSSIAHLSGYNSNDFFHLVRLQTSRIAIKSRHQVPTSSRVQRRVDSDAATVRCATSRPVARPDAYAPTNATRTFPTASSSSGSSGRSAERTVEHTPPCVI